MKNVIVLMNDEQQKSPFLNNLSMTEQPPKLCRFVTPTKAFDFQIFGLSTNDKKL